MPGDSRMEQSSDHPYLIITYDWCYQISSKNSSNQSLRVSSLVTKRENPNRCPIRNEAEWPCPKRNIPTSALPQAKPTRRGHHTQASRAQAGATGPQVTLKGAPGDTEGGHSAACLSPKQPCARGWFAAVRGTASDIPRVKCTLEAAGTQGGAASGWVSLSQARTPGWPMKIPGERVCVPDTAWSQTPPNTGVWSRERFTVGSRKKGSCVRKPPNSPKCFSTAFLKARGGKGVPGYVIAHAQFSDWLMVVGWQGGVTGVNVISP